MKFVITGGAGFIGSHIAKHLVNEGHDVVIVDNLSRGRLENLSKIKEQIEDVLGIDASDASLVSAKTGQGVEQLLEKIITKQLRINHSKK